MTTLTTKTKVIKPDSSQGQPEVVVATAMDQIDKYIGSNMASLFGRRSDTTALTWQYHGGTYNVDGAFVSIADGSLTLTASTTNYIETTIAGVVSRNTTGFSANQIPLYEVVTDAAGITTETDRRDWLRHPFLTVMVKAMPSDANYPLTAAEARADVIHIVAGTTLTAQRDITLPLMKRMYTVFNSSTGGFPLRFIGSSGSGVVVQNKQRAQIYFDGTNFVPVSVDGLTQDIAFAATITPDVSVGNVIIVGAITGATLTINAPTNLVKGQTVTFRLLQDGTGSRTITWNAIFKKSADGAGTANQNGVTQFLYDGTDLVQMGGALTWL